MMGKTKFIGLALTLLSVSAFAGDECKDWDQKCQDIESFRRKRAQEPDSELCITCNVAKATESLANETTKNLNSLNTMVRTLSFDDKKYFSCLETVSEQFRTMAAQDVKLLKDLFAKYGINSLSAEDIEAGFLKPDGYFAQHYHRVSLDNAGKVDYLRKYALNGPYNGVLESLSGVASFTPANTSSGIFSVEKKAFDKAGIETLKEQGDGKKVLSFLFARAEKGGTELAGGFPASPREGREALSPAVAKIILFETLRDRLKDNQPALADVIRQLNLKYDYRNQAGSDLEPSEHDLPDGSKFLTTDSVSVHDGYFLGSEKFNFPSKDKIPYSVGYDCTVYIQKCETEAGLKFPASFRLFSGDLLALAKNKTNNENFKFYSSLYRTERYTCEAQLHPGDVIVFVGHAFTFAGYKTDENGRTQIVTYEAKGGESRSVGRNYREFYQSDVCSPALFSAHGDTEAYIVRVK